MKHEDPHEKKFFVRNSGAELLYGERKRRSGATAVEGSRTSDCRDDRDGEKTSSSIRSFSEEEKLRLKERYSMEYSRYAGARARTDTA